MPEATRPRWGTNVCRLRSIAGLAAAIVPCAIIVHLVAEAAAIGRGALRVEFLLRHAYFAVMFAASAWWFARTLGLGRSAAERRRRCALVRADLDGPQRRTRLFALLAANVAFFTVTQGVEGMPIGAGSLLLGLAVALAGSLIAAFLVFFFGTTILRVAVACAIGYAPFRRCFGRFALGDRRIVVSRCATSAYSLFIPNRPPPSVSPI